MSPIADYNLGTARGKIEIDSSGVEQGLNTTSKSVKGFQGGMEGASTSLVKVGGAMSLVGVAAVAGFGLAVNASANFEQRLSAISAVTGATGKDLDDLRKKALKLGADTKFSAGEAATAIEELAKAGIPVKEILEGAANAVTDLAAAGEIDLANAAIIVSNSMNSFGIAGTDAARVANVFASAANTSAADVDTLGQSLSQVSAVAATVGLSFEDTVAALALFADKGLKGSDAGTSLKTMLLNLQPTTDKQINLFRELGILTGGTGDKLERLGGQALTQATLLEKMSNASAVVKEEFKKAGASVTANGQAFTDAEGRMISFEQVQKTLISSGKLTEKEFGALGIQVAKGSNQFFDAAGKLRPLAEIQTVLQKATAGMTDAQRLLTLEQIGGSDAVRAFSIITTSSTEDLSAHTTALGRQGVAQEVAAKKMDNLKGSMEQFKGSIETAMISIGSMAQGPIKSVVDFLTKLVNGFMALSPGMQQAIVIGALVAATFIGLVGGLILMVGLVMKAVIAYQQFAAALKFVKGLHLVTKAMTALNASFLANPVFLIIAALAALGLALFVVYKKSETFRNIVDGLWQSFQAGFDIVLGVGKAIFGWISDHWKLLAVILLLPIAPILAVVAGFFLFKDKVFEAVGAVIEFIQELPGKTVKFVVQMVEEIVAFISSLPGRIGYAIGFMIGTWLRFWITLIQLVIEWAPKIVLAISNFLKELPGKMASFFWNAIQVTVDFISDMIGKGVDLGSRFLGAIVEFFQELPGKLASFFVNAVKTTVQFVTDLVANAQKAGKDFAGSLIDGITGLPGAVGDILGRVITTIKDKIKEAFNAVKDFAGGLWKGFQEGLGIKSPSFIEKAMTTMVDNVQSDMRVLRSQIGTIQGLGAGIPTIPGLTVNGGGSGAVVNITQTFGGPVDRAVLAEANGNLTKELLQVLRSR